jgi:hypothetical protein
MFSVFFFCCFELYRCGSNFLCYDMCFNSSYLYMLKFFSCGLLCFSFIYLFSL